MLLQQKELLCGKGSCTYSSCTNSTRTLKQPNYYIVSHSFSVPPWAIFTVMLQSMQNFTVDLAIVATVDRMVAQAPAPLA